METLITSWLHYKHTIKRASDHTLRSYRTTGMRYITWLANHGLDFETVETSDIVQFIAETWPSCADSTIANRIWTLRSLHTQLVKSGHTKRNPAASIDPPDVEDPNIPPPTPDEMLQLLRSIDPAGVHGARLRAIVALLFGCGMRISELRGIRLEDLSLTRRELYIRGKGRRNRTVPIPPGMVVSLIAIWIAGRPSAEHAAGNAHLFPGNDIAGQHASKTIYDWLADAARLAGLEARCFNPHAFRHGFGTALVGDGLVAESDAQLLFGHSDIETTRRYTRTAHMRRLRRVVDRHHPWSATQPETPAEPVSRRSWGCRAS